MSHTWKGPEGERQVAKILTKAFSFYGYEFIRSRGPNEDLKLSMFGDVIVDPKTDPGETSVWWQIYPDVQYGKPTIRKKLRQGRFHAMEHAPGRIPIWIGKRPTKKANQHNQVPWRCAILEDDIGRMDNLLGVEFPWERRHDEVVLYDFDPFVKQLVKAQSTYESGY